MENQWETVLSLLQGRSQKTLAEISEVMDECKNETADFQFVACKMLLCGLMNQTAILAALIALCADRADEEAVPGHETINQVLGRDVAVDESGCLVRVESPSCVTPETATGASESE